MIVLDTNVVSELMKAEPAPSVTRWAAGQAPSNLYTTSITQAEILHGILLLPAGRRRSAFEAAADAMFKEDFGGRILAFDSAAAEPYAQIAALHKRAGRAMTQFDAQIAAVALSAGAAVATRNVKDFEQCGIPLINPWTA
jgi:toxin FitB